MAVGDVGAIGSDRTRAGRLRVDPAVPPAGGTMPGRGRARIVSQRAFGASPGTSVLESRSMALPLESRSMALPLVLLLTWPGLRTYGRGRRTSGNRQHNGARSSHRPGCTPTSYRSHAPHHRRHRHGTTRTHCRAASRPARPLGTRSRQGRRSRGVDQPVTGIVEPAPTFQRIWWMPASSPHAVSAVQAPPPRRCASARQSRSASDRPSPRRHRRAAHSASTTATGSTWRS